MMVTKDRVHYSFHNNNCCLFSAFVTVLDDKAGNLRYQSEKYKKDAKYLNLRTTYAKYAAVAIVLMIFLIYVRYWLF